MKEAINVFFGCGAIALTIMFVGLIWWALGNKCAHCVQHPEPEKERPMPCPKCGGQMDFGTFYDDSRVWFDAFRCKPCKWLYQPWAKYPIP